jgi:bifunctional non-homologous end joining protein LigD
MSGLLLKGCIRAQAIHAATLWREQPNHDGWVYKEKIDGYRMVAYKDDDGVRLISRNGRDHSRRFPELVKVLCGLKPKSFILDGEVAVFDEGLISRFEWLRTQPKDEPATLPVYIAFDILELAGRDLRDRPLKQRRRVLERLVWHHSMIFPARRLADDGLKAWQEAMARGYHPRRHCRSS